MSADNSPNSLIAKPNATKMSKKPLAIMGIVGVLLFGILFWSVNYGSAPEEGVDGQKEVPISETEEQPLWLVEGSGLTLNPKTEQVSGVITPEAPTPSPQETINVPSANNEAIVLVQGKGLSEEEQHLRRMKSQAYLEALNSPLVSKKFNNENNTAQENTENSGTNSTQVGFDRSSSPSINQSSYDVSADKDKEAFFDRARQPDNAWILNNARTAGQEFEIKTGTVIPAVMITGINSDLPGNIIAQVSQNVYDSTSGQNLLIPQGAKLFGEYDSRVIFGQNRVLVAWNRLIYPDGSAITLPAFQGSDMAGNAGFKDKVNNHYFRIFGSAILMSLVTGATTYAVDGATSGSSEDEASLQSSMTTALAQQLGEATTALLEKNLSIKPTLEIRAGFQFNVVITKDIIFESPYMAWR